MSVERYTGQYVQSGKFTLRFVRIKDDLLEVQWGVQRIYLPVSAIQEALEGQWEADSMEHLARKVS